VRDVPVVPSGRAVTADRRRVHPGPSRLKTACLCGLLVFRLCRVVAELQSRLNVGEEAVTDGQNLKCSYHDCDKTRSPDTEFCTSCEYETRRDAEKLVRETGAYLHLEAAFVEWCREHGLPNPHE
jgi:hypothetical protein